MARKCESSLNQNICELSGGNQQKVLLGRWLAPQSKILILDEPTKGVDVGTKHEIRKIIEGLSVEGYSIVMISSEMTEIIGISHRILVFHQGRITGEFSEAAVSEEAIVLAAINHGAHTNVL